MTHEPNEKQESPVKTVSQAEYEALLSKLKELETLREQMLRSAADFENAKKRILKEREDFAQYAFENFFYDLLPTLDNFERALAHRDDLSKANQSIWSGIQLIQKQLTEILKSRGLIRMDVLKKPFDPHFHEAVGKVESAKEPEGLVAEEELSGYFLNGKVLRPAKVKVFTKDISSDEKIEEIT